MRVVTCPRCGREKWAYMGNDLDAEPVCGICAREPISWTDSDMAQAYEAGWQACFAEHVSASGEPAVDIVDLAEAFGSWLNDYEAETV